MKKKISYFFILISFFSFSQSDNDFRLEELKIRVKTMSSDSLFNTSLKLLNTSQKFTEEEKYNLSVIYRSLVYCDVMLTEAIDRDYKIEESYYWRAIAKYSIRSYLSALRDFTYLSDLFPENAIVFDWKAKCKLRLNDYYGAIEDLDKAILLETNENSTNTENLAKMYQRRSLANMELEQYSQSISDINKSIELNGKDGASYLLKGNYVYFFIDKKDGCLAWSKAGELGEDIAYSLIKKYCN